MSTYRAVYEREPDGSAWNVSFPEAPGCFTWGRSLRQAQNRAAEALACHLDAKEAEAAFYLEHEVSVPRANEAVAEAREARRRLAQIQAEAQQATARAAKALVAAGLTRRDAGAVLGLSHQRVDQLVG